MAGRAPRFQMCARKAWLLKPRSATTHFGTPGKRSRSGMACGSSWAWPGARIKATPRPSPSAIPPALVPTPPRERPRASRASRCSLGAPFFPRPPPCGAPGCWCHPETSSRVEPRALGPRLLGQEHPPRPDAQVGPDTQVGPADEGLRRPRPGPQLRGDGPPLGSILMAPEDGRERAPQILRLLLTLGPTRLDQRLQVRPLRVRHHRPLLIPEGAKRPSSQTVQARTGPKTEIRVIALVASSLSTITRAATDAPSQSERPFVSVS